MAPRRYRVPPQRSQISSNCRGRTSAPLFRDRPVSSRLSSHISMSSFPGAQRTHRGPVEVGVPPALLLPPRVVFVLVARPDERDAEVALLPVHRHLALPRREGRSRVLQRCSLTNKQQTNKQQTNNRQRSTKTEEEEEEEEGKEEEEGEEGKEEEEEEEGEEEGEEVSH
ncbi:hypothetical protein EYF80_060460 [Liparis tanakae]|uniref:Uncharacterized protein n=1 Tax=Liparis tanakae TaxID=230148 RepID=A0A4Z2EM13_9TELE|nr:hypothetical protein EYF80_060460 [Liparis tanakae]